MFRSLILLTLILLGLAAQAEETVHPNFLIIVADDISASSVGCYGADNLHTTPNIDKLANQRTTSDLRLYHVQLMDGRFKLMWNKKGARKKK